jgi:alpha/beta superfamily hydrolase
MEEAALMTSSAEQDVRVRMPRSAGRDGIELEARLASVVGTGAAVVAPPHPLYGGRLDNPVVEALCRGFGRAGVSTLRFNFRGAGASTGAPTGDLDLALEDYAAALATLREHASRPYVAAGYSFGAATALRAAASAPDVSAVLLVAPPVAMLEARVLERVKVPLLVVVGDGDNLAPSSRLATELLAAESARLEVIEGEDHFFGWGTGLDAIEDYARALLR